VRPWMLMLVGASLDVVVAGILFVAGFKVFGAFMGVVAVVGFGLAVWMRGQRS
jgi:hypothetical protein